MKHSKISSTIFWLLFLIGFSSPVFALKKSPLMKHIMFFAKNGTLSYSGMVKAHKELGFSDGILLKKLQYRNYVLVGEAVYYDSDGNISIEGSYKNGKKHGLWKYYKNGKVTLEEIYPKPIKKTKN